MAAGSGEAGVRRLAAQAHSLRLRDKVQSAQRAQYPPEIANGLMEEAGRRQLEACWRLGSRRGGGEAAGRCVLVRFAV